MPTSVFQAYNKQLNFNHLQAYAFQKIEKYSNKDGMRIYRTPYGDMPSMTTILDIIENPSIEKWKKRVGEKKAEAIRQDAAERGDVLHNMCENFLHNRSDYEEIAKAEHRHKLLFNRMIPALCRIDNIVGLEVELFSRKYFTAGTVDCIGCFDGIPSIIDFKGSTKYKEVTWIHNYFLQETGYSIMFEEMTGGRWPIDQIVTIISCEESATCQVIIKNRKDYIDDFIQAQKNFATKYPHLMNHTLDSMLH